MKKLFFGAFIALALVSCKDEPNIEVGQKTTMEIDTIYNAGNVIKGEMINARFKVKNTGEYPLVFGEVKGSCSCTITEKPDKAIQPGETGMIYAQVNTDRISIHNVTKYVTIMANTEPNVTVVTIKGYIK